MADMTVSNGVTNGSAQIVFNAAADSQTFPFYKDERMGIILKNDGAATLSGTISKGTGICSVNGDLGFEVPAGDMCLLGPLESAQFKNMSTGKGTMVLGASASVSIAVVQL